MWGTCCSCKGTAKVVSIITGPADDFVICRYVYPISVDLELMYSIMV